MKILVTGNLGYVGNVLVKKLVEMKYDVLGYDVGYYPQNFIDAHIPKIAIIKKDIRNIAEEDLKNCFAVLHLAALSNDPLGELNFSLTNEINYVATIRLAKLAKKSNVKRFVFSSTCSNYGSKNDIVNEESALSPITAYARSKVYSENELLKLKDEEFSPTILRSATAYGVSSSLRLDLVVNNLTCSAVATGSVKLLSDGTAWRPLVHVEDMSNAFIKVLESNEEKVSGNIFNVGSNEENYTIKQIAEIVEDIVPDSKIEYAREAIKDSRSYHVNFDKIKHELGYKTQWKLKDAIREIYNIFKKKNIIEKDFRNRKYYRVAYIKWLVEQGKLDNDLFFKN